MMKKANKVSTTDGMEIKNGLVRSISIIRTKIIEKSLEKIIPSNIPEMQANNPIIMISNTYIPDICSLFIPKS